MKNTKSPLKDNPLRNPDQSLDEKIDYLINDKFLTYYFVTIALIIMAAVEWLRSHCYSRSGWRLKKGVGKSWFWY